MVKRPLIEQVRGGSQGGVGVNSLANSIFKGALQYRKKWWLDQVDSATIFYVHEEIWGRCDVFHIKL